MTASCGEKLDLAAGWKFLAGKTSRVLGELHAIIIEWKVLESISCKRVKSRLEKLG